MKVVQHFGEGIQRFPKEGDSHSEGDSTLRKRKFTTL